MPIAELAARPPAALVGGAIVTCEGPTLDAETWWREARVIEGELLYMNELRALELGDAALAATACLDGPVSAQRLSQVAFWTGLAAHYVGRADQADQALAWARAADPARAWNDDLGDDGRARFEAALPTARARLSWVAPGFGDALLDGRPIAAGAEVVPGPHLLQLRGPDGTWLGLRLHATAPETRIGVPAALGDHSPALADDPVERVILSDLLAAALGPGEPVYVAGARVWRGTTGRTDWTVVPGTRIVKRGRPAIVAGGGAVVLGGAITAGVAYAGAARADADRCEADTAEAWGEADGRWRRNRGLYALGWSGVAAGIGLGITGALLPRQRVSAQVWLGPGGGGLGVVVRR